RLFNLEVDNAKMLITEKLTVLSARLAVCFVVFVVGTCTLIFASVAAADFLLDSLPARWTYLILASFYFLVMVILICFRKRIFVNPIARFMTRVILDPPCQDNASTDAISTHSDNRNIQD
ncbi:MAG: phage holin family protein, partial [Muribaculaceae bacterium]|nr:phage holin family protein [Muribaculaceae bacterium]